MIYRILAMLTFIGGFAGAAATADSGGNSAVVFLLGWLATVILMFLADFQDFHRDWKRQRDRA